MSRMARPSPAKSCRRGRVRSSFALDGHDYEIDLTNESAAELRSAFRRYIDAGPSGRSAGREHARGDGRTAAVG
ncbi:hypothetical protein E4P40_09915 [Blastococcus sp. CT_GayMR20]|nr:hypothetical protein E4P40_09915 [Blastococcus sp. CT_GayMR20]